MIIQRSNKCLRQPKAQTSIVSTRSVKVLKQGTSNIPPDIVPTPETIQTVAQLTREWVDPVLNRERLTKEQVLAQLGGGNHGG